jgi:hypothetical protein
MALLSGKGLDITDLHFSSGDHSRRLAGNKGTALAGSGCVQDVVSDKGRTSARSSRSSRKDLQANYARDNELVISSCKSIVIYASFRLAIVLT